MGFRFISAEQKEFGIFSSEIKTKVFKKNFFSSFAPSISFSESKNFFY